MDHRDVFRSGRDLDLLDHDVLVRDVLEEAAAAGLDATDLVDDVEYQRFRAMVRNPQWRAAVLAKPLAERLAMAAEVRMQSEHSKQEKSAEIMDVNAGAVEEVLRANGYPDMIHGHTHRPARHTLSIDGHACERWVLHDWHEKAEWLAWNETDGLRFESL